MRSNPQLNLREQQHLLVVIEHADRSIAVEVELPSLRKHVLLRLIEGRGDVLLVVVGAAVRALVLVVKLRS